MENVQRKAFLLTASVNIILAVNCSSAFGDATSTAAGVSQPAQSATPATTPAAAPAPAPPPPPARAAGVLIGSVVGTPICVVRKTIDEEKYGIHGIVGESDNKALRLAAGAFWLPFSILLGTAESPVSATVNAVRKSNKPFGKSQFAIADCKKKASQEQAKPEDKTP